MKKTLFENEAMEGFGVNKGTLHREITYIITEIRNTCKSAFDLKASWHLATKLEDLILKETGIKVIVSKDDFKTFATSAFAVMLNKSNAYFNPEKHLGLPTAFETFIGGTIDRENYKITGNYSQIPNILYLEENILFKDYTVSDSSISAFICHEIGHIFNYFEGASRIVYDNYRLLQNFQRLIGTDRKKEVKEIFVRETFSDKEFSAAVNLDKLTEENKDNIFITYVATNYKKMEDNTGESGLYKQQSESMADRFAAHHGCGLELIKGLDAIKHTEINYVLKKSKFNNITRFIIYITKMMVAAFTAASAVALSPMLMSVSSVVALFYMVVVSKKMFKKLTAFSGYEVDIYPDLRDRFILIRNSSRELLKDKNRSKQEMSDILESIKQMEEIIEQYSDMTDVFISKFRLFIFRAERKKAAYVGLQRDIEELTNNKLFESAAKFRTI